MRLLFSLFLLAYLNSCQTIPGISKDNPLSKNLIEKNILEHKKSTHKSYFSLRALSSYSKPYFTITVEEKGDIRTNTMTVILSGSSIEDFDFDTPPQDFGLRCGHFGDFVYKHKAKKSAWKPSTNTVGYRRIWTSHKKVNNKALETILSCKNSLIPVVSTKEGVASYMDWPNFGDGVKEIAYLNKLLEKGIKLKLEKL